MMTVQQGAALRRHNGFRQALHAVAVDLRVHEFANDRAVFGHEGYDGAIGSDGGRGHDLPFRWGLLCLSSIHHTGSSFKQPTNNNTTPTTTNKKTAARSFTRIIKTKALESTCRAPY